MLALIAGVALALDQIDCASASQSPLTPECYGTPHSHGITGQNAPDFIYAKGVDDHVDTYSGNDVVYGGEGADYAVGMEADDRCTADVVPTN